MSQIGTKIADMLGVFLAFVPLLIGGLMVLLVGHIIAKLLQGATRKALTAAHVDARLRQSDMGQWMERVTPTPTRMVSRVVYWLVFLTALSLALTVLNITALSAFVAAVFAYLPNVIAAIAILVVAGGVSAVVAAAVSRSMGETPTGKVVGIAVPAVTMTIATFMALNQLMIAPAIVNITFTALVGALALGGALAFGLGGREVAGQILQDAYGRGQEGVRQARQDFQTGRQRAESQVKSAMPEQASPRESYGAVPQPAFGETLDQSQTNRTDDDTHEL